MKRRKLRHSKKIALAANNPLLPPRPSRCGIATNRRNRLSYSSRNEKKFFGNRLKNSSLYYNVRTVNKCLAFSISKHCHHSKIFIKNCRTKIMDITFTTINSKKITYGHWHNKLSRYECIEFHFIHLHLKVSTKLHLFKVTLIIF